MAMIKARNQSSHTDYLEQAQAIRAAVITRFTPLFHELQERLQALCQGHQDSPESQQGR